MLKKRFFKTKDECEVTFEYTDEQADTIAVVTAAHEWQPVEMNQLKGGTFKARLRLPVDEQIQYLYLVDGERWVHDAEADGHIPNEFGGYNSIVNTTPNGN